MLASFKLFRLASTFDKIILFQSWFFGFDHNLFNNIKNKNPKINLFCIDLESNEMIFIYYAKLLENFDLIFTSDSLVAENIYNQIGIKSKFLPFVYSEKNFYNKNSKKIYDISFIGQKHSTRPIYINHLRENKFNVKTFGAYENERISWVKINDIYNQTKINLYFSFQKRRKDKIFDLTMDRNMKSSLLHFIMSESFFLIEYSKEHNSIINEFPELMFKSKFELLEKVNFFLHNENERNYMITKIQKKIGKKYNFENFKNFFLDEIEKNNTQKVKTRTNLSKKYNFVIKDSIKKEDVLIDHNFFFQWNLSLFRQKKLLHIFSFFKYFFIHFDIIIIFKLLSIYVVTKLKNLFKNFFKKKTKF